MQIEPLNTDYQHFIACIDAIKCNNSTLTFFQSYEQLRNSKYEGSSNYVNNITTFIFMCTNEELVSAFMATKQYYYRYAILGMAKSGNIERFYRFFKSDSTHITDAYTCEKLVWLFIYESMEYHPQVATKVLSELYIFGVNNTHTILLAQQAIKYSNVEFVNRIVECASASICREIYPEVCASKWYDLAIRIVVNEFDVNDWSLCYRLAQSARAFPVMMYIIKNTSQRLDGLRTRAPRNLQVVMMLYRYKYINEDQCKRRVMRFKEWRHIAENMVLLQSGFNIPIDVTRLIRTYLY